MGPAPPASWISGAADYAGYIGVAFAGSFLRANQWRNAATGDVIWGKVLFEIPVAIAVGAVAIGLGEYFHLDPKITGGICGILGLLGPAFFSALGDTILTILKNKLGG